MHLFYDDMDTLITTVEALAPLDDDGDLRARVEALEASGGAESAPRFAVTPSGRLKRGTRLRIGWSA